MLLGMLFEAHQFLKALGSRNCQAFETQPGIHRTANFWSFGEVIGCLDLITNIEISHNRRRYKT